MTLTLTVTRGLPGSGKTTWALGWAARTGAARVNRDSLRDMLHGPAYRRTAEQEDAVTAASRGAVAGLLGDGLSVVVDDTNLGPAVMQYWADLADQQNAALAVVDFTAVPLSACVARDRSRPVREPDGGCVGAQVGEAVIVRMHAEYLAGGRSDLWSAAEATRRGHPVLAFTT